MKPLHLKQRRLIKSDLTKAEPLEEIVLREAGVECQITFQGKYVGVKTVDFADYFLARSVLKGRVGLPICRAI